jgi:CTP:molybdopterin cytidylyltransferase MocA
MIIAMIPSPTGEPRPDSAADDVIGVLLAAGAGRRAGGPKALRRDPDGTSWLLRSISVMRDGGCAAVVVVLGSSAGAARDVITTSALDQQPQISIVVAPDWQRGMGSSLRAGLSAVPPGSCRAVLVHLVDLPDVTAGVVSRLIRQAPTGTGALARATYGGRPGHPVLIGWDHLSSIAAELTGDRGAKEYLARHGADGVECSDLATGRDRDR